MGDGTRSLGGVRRGAGRTEAGGAAGWVAAALLVVAGFGVSAVAQAQTLATWPRSDKVLVRNSAGVPVLLDLSNVRPSTGNAGGGGTLRAVQRMTVGGVGAELGLSRVVNGATLARAVRMAARVSGPVAIGSLVLDGIRWANGEWQEDRSKFDPYSQKNWFHQLSGLSCASVAGKCGIEKARAEAVQHYTEGMIEVQITGTMRTSPPGETEVYSVAWQGKMPRGKDVPPEPMAGTLPLWGVDKSASGVPEWQPAQDGSMESAIGKALRSSEGGGQLLDNPVVRDQLDAAGGADPLQVAGPAALNGGTRTQTTTRPDGTTATTTTTTTYNVTYNNNVVNVTQTTTTTNPDGSTTEETSEVPSDPTAPKPETDIETCGLPGKPPCKIDETGTPKKEETVTAAESALKAAMDQAEAKIAEVTAKEGFGWTLGLPSLPASCAPIQVGNVMTLDICPAVEIGRTGFAFLWAALAGLYCWRRVGATVAEGA